MLHTDPRSSQQWPQERAKSTWRTSSPTTQQQLALKLVRNFVSSVIGSDGSIPISSVPLILGKRINIENQPLNVDSDSSLEKWWSRVASTAAIAVYFMHITRDSIGLIVICLWGFAERPSYLFLHFSNRALAISIHFWSIREAAAKTFIYLYTT